ELVRKNLGEANFFAFGIGSSVNRHLIEGLARAGMGEAFVVLNANEAPREAARFRKMIEAPVLTGIRIDYAGLGAYDVDPPAVPDLLADRPLVIVGKYRGDGRGTLTVRGMGGEGRFERKLASAGAADPGLGALVHLWARRRVAELGDRQAFGGGDQREPIVALGVRYHLLTEHTSFVAVDTVRRRESGELVTVRQPLPLPQGVSRLALGSGEEAAPTGDRDGDGVPDVQDLDFEPSAEAEIDTETDL